MKTIQVDDIKRIGNYIKLGQGRTATEGNDGLHTLTIRENGKVIHRARGSSLTFNAKLTDEDKRYLANLASDSK